MPNDYHHGVRVVEKSDGTRPIRTIETGIIGVVGTAPDADPNLFPIGEPVLIAGSRTKAAKLDTTGNGQGTLPGVMDAIFDQVAPLMVVVRVDEDTDPAKQLSNIIGTVDAAGHYTGLQALLAANNKLGVKPRILGAPGFSHLQPVADELGSIAEKLRGFAYADTPAVTGEGAVVYRRKFGNKRLMLCWPGFKVWDVPSAGYMNQPASARALGMRAKLDNDIGWHKTISNVPVNGVSGLTADVDWDLQNPATMAGVLNANEVTTLVMQNGYRFWGSRTCSGDPMFAFESAVRTGDVLADTIAEAHMWAVDKPMSQVLIEEIIEGVNAKFRELKAHGYIVNAECYLDPELNNKESLQAGKLWLDYDYTPVPPLEQLGFYAHITNKYLVELLPGAKAA
ncbi:MAG: phage tail sheath protein [Candidatus Sedimenticola sp. 6PFRAG7]